MRSYVALILINLRLTLRDKAALFFSYIFPLIFFFIFAQSTDAEQGGVIVQVVTMVLILGVLGNGLFGAGVRAVQERELNILRRFKVTPISPAPILAASMVTGWLLFLPAVILTLALAHWMYGMPAPQRWISLAALVSLGVIAFRAIGLIIASVVNTMQESAILTQALYLPMLFLSGAVFPVSMLPDWLQIVTQFLPASYLATAFQGVLLRREGLAENLSAVAAMLLTTALATFISVKLFRWEKEEKLPASAKLWVVAVLLPFVFLGAWEARTRGNVNKAKLLYRDQRRGRTLLIRGARIFTGDGTVIASGGVLVKDGKIDRVFPGDSPDPKTVKAEAIEGFGKTVLPGLIDAHIHLSAPGGLYDPPTAYEPEKAAARALAAYLYCGVTTVRSAGDPVELMRKVRLSMRNGERLGADLFFCGPLFTAAGGRGEEHFDTAPAAWRQPVLAPATPEEARQRVAGMARAGVDAVQAVLDAGQAGTALQRMDVPVLRAIIEEAHARKLRVIVHTGDAQDVADAVAAGADSIEHGSLRDLVPEIVFAQMARRRVSYDPTLAAAEALVNIAGGNAETLDRSLAQQVGPRQLLAGTRKLFAPPGSEAMRARAAERRVDLEIGMENLRRAHKAGVPLVAGTGAGNILVFHGPALHRELQLWVRAGIPPADALRAATSTAAWVLGADGRAGLIRRGLDADLLIVDGNPLQEISDTERISSVIFRGERLARSGLFEQK